jgi:DNA primase small subunit
MALKGWLGADLIFDLDADHLEGASKMSYAEMLEGVKAKFVLLVDGFLRDELGYTERELDLNFSGSRGYHAHIRDPRIRELDSAARRQIVDYITKKVPVSALVRRATVGRTEHRIIKGLRVPKTSEGGWPGRIARRNCEYLARLASDPRPLEERAAQLQSETGVPLKEAKALLGTFGPSPKAMRERLARLEEGIADLTEGLGEKTYVRMFEYHLENLRGWCDEPVSSDTKRLIRAAGSIHGKTGLKAVRLSRTQLDGFDPLVDAVVLPDDPVAVNVSRPIKVELKGQTFDLKPGVQKLPQYVAVFTILRRHALLEGDTPPTPPPPKAAAPAAPAKPAP